MNVARKIFSACVISSEKEEDCQKEIYEYKQEVQNLDLYASTPFYHVRISFPVGPFICKDNF